MDFIAPKNSHCNPFLKIGDLKRLTCWIGWEHEEYIFIIASDVGSQPKYCLRFPRVQDGEFSVLVYFSVVCPIENDGKPVHGIEYYELRMFKKDIHACRDENSSKCVELMTSPEVCVKDKIFAPHCPKTCGRCSQHTVSDINTRRCWIDPALYGDWFLYDNSSVVEVMISRERAIFSHMGTFQCLNMDMKGRRYKMASLFNNGCSPRYTCMEFIRRNNNVLQYRVGPSERLETKMDDMCTFRNDPHPLLDFYRSEYFKNLILVKNLWPSHCGLQSLIPFNGTINGRPCAGTISDWDEDTCSMLGTLTLKSETCRELILPIEYQCVAYINDDAIPLQQLLLTRSLDGKDTFNCWVITSYVGGGHWPWRAVYQLPTPQCSLVTEIDMTAGSSTAAFYLDDRARKKVCKPEETRQHVAQNDVTKFASTDQSYNITKQGVSDNDETDIRVQTKPSNVQPSEHPPLTDYYNTDTPAWSLYSTGNCVPTELYRELLFVVSLSVLHFISIAALLR